jgi:tetratricopeptide (TPR) repeat protein
VLNHGNAIAFLGDALRRLGQLEAALTDYNNAIALAPDLAEAHAKGGITLHPLHRLEAAIVSYKHALALDQDYPFLVGRLLFAHESICNWRTRAFSFERHVFGLRRELLCRSMSFPCSTRRISNGMRQSSTARRGLRPARDVTIPREECR